MQRLKTALTCVLLAALILVSVSVVLLVRTATAVVAAVPGEIQATRAALVAEIDTTRADLINQVETSRKDFLGKADAQFSTIQSESFRQITDSAAWQTGAWGTRWRARTPRSARSRRCATT